MQDDGNLAVFNKNQGLPTWNSGSTMITGRIYKDETSKGSNKHTFSTA